MMEFQSSIICVCVSIEQILPDCSSLYPADIQWQQPKAVCRNCRSYVIKEFVWTWDISFWGFLFVCFWVLGVKTSRLTLLYLQDVKLWLLMQKWHMEVGKEAAVLVVQQGGWKTWSCLAAGSHLSLCNAWVCLQCIYGPGIFTSILCIAHTFDAHTFEQQMLSVVSKAPINFTLFLSVSLGFFFCSVLYFNVFILASGVHDSHILLWGAQHLGRWVTDEEKKKNRGWMMEEKQKRTEKLGEDSLGACMSSKIRHKQLFCLSPCCDTVRVPPPSFILF